MIRITLWLLFSCSVLFIIVGCNNTSAGLEKLEDLGIIKSYYIFKKYFICILIRYNCFCSTYCACNEKTQILKKSIGLFLQKTGEMVQCIMKYTNLLKTFIDKI
ncbi:hypothetical protein RBH29_04910 [Herbivorax sp. ANBcel31]|uniref:hypothetical protein n=1 Tax=Herbivorax sp. ANBcel31 TaxID=3069754 RepID=UPI0027B4C536|nr:hypothetical protein [Herbivorax sp. ANBcel31]MDQ2085774.1 hypothetical protein [Herbivorax sp. ANBcel31]